MYVYVKCFFLLCSSGPLVPPYDYNGFIAKLEFLEKIDTSGPPPTMAASPPLAALTHFTHDKKPSLYLTG